MRTNRSCLPAVVALAMALALPACRQAEVTSPASHLGFAIGDDYHLANYTQISDYLRKLERESKRVSVVEFGTTSEGRPMLMAVVTAGGNQKRIDRYREIARRLALAEGVSEQEARLLAAEGKAVVWFDAGLHATETVNAQAMVELIYQMASRDDEETRRVLEDVILLAAFSNPDGLELVADWYMREPDASKRSLANLPVLYQKYIGHDNNRESLLANMPESASIARVLYREWFPQIMWNQHQSGPPGTVLFIGQMRDPSNPNLDPLIAPSTELLSAAIHARFVSEGKPGAVSRSAASYQNWWNGGIRSTACFHNQVAILSEISGGPTPGEIVFVPRRLVAGNDNPFPVHPRTWHMRDAVEYLLTASRAVLDTASKHREDFLLNAYRMGARSIEKGSRDSWTIDAARISAVEASIAAAEAAPSGRSGYPRTYYEQLRDPSSRDPRAYIIPSSQADFLTATKFVNALIKNGIAVHRATAPFEAGGRNYPSGSYVVRTAQAFRPHIIDNFEAQHYPNDFEYPGGPPIRPYDMTGYTLAFQMGVRFDRVLEGLEGPFELVGDVVEMPAGKVSGDAPAGFLISHAANDAFAAVNRLIEAGEEVYRLKAAVYANAKVYDPGTFYVVSKGSTANVASQVAAATGVDFDGVSMAPAGDALRLKRPRVGVVDRYGGSMPSGWMQWLMEQYGFEHEPVFPPRLDAGNLAADYDVLILENGLMPAPGRGEAARPDPRAIPEQFRMRIGAMTETETVPRLIEFMEQGGTIIAIGSSTSLAYAAGVPVRNALVAGRPPQPLTSEQFYVPGSLLRVRADNQQPLAWGLPEEVDVFFDNSPVFQIGAGRGARRVAWFESDKPLRSGWAWGQERLLAGVVAAEADVGKGRLVLFGPLVTFRAHTHGTFKFVFNALHHAKAEPVRLVREAAPMTPE
jgi:hypothetical protein